MDFARAISVLMRVLGHLHPGVWWSLPQLSPNDFDADRDSKQYEDASSTEKDNEESVASQH